MCVSGRMEGVRDTYINRRMANAYCEIKITDFLTWVGRVGKTVGTILCT